MEKENSDTKNEMHQLSLTVKAYTETGETNRELAFPFLFF